jgi:hypothetical protein
MLDAHKQRTRVQLHCLTFGHRLYHNYAMRRDYSSSGRTGSTSTMPCTASTRLPAVAALRQPRRALRVLVSRLQRLYVNLAVHTEYSSPGCSGFTSTTPRVRVPRHVARLVTRLVALLVVDYSASLRLVVDYFAYAACPGASALRAARHAAHRAARRRLLRFAQARRRLPRLRRASG